MDRKYATYIFAGLVVGALVGLMWGSGTNNLIALAIGALVGTAVGWFYAAYRMEQEKAKTKAGK